MTIPLPLLILTLLLFVGRIGRKAWTEIRRYRAFVFLDWAEAFSPRVAIAATGRMMGLFFATLVSQTGRTSPSVSPSPPPVY